jgi:hypothetical protein
MSNTTSPNIDTGITGEHLLKGITEPIGVWELDWASPEAL